MPSLRSLASQLCGIFPYVCLQFAYGSFAGYVVVIIAELHKPDSEIAASLDQLSWFASLDVLKVAGTLLTGLTMHRLGSRSVALTATLLMMTACLLYHYSRGATAILAGRVLSSVLSMKPLVSPYISEVSEPRLRGPFLAVVEMAFSAGSFVALLLGSLMYWRSIALVNLALSAVGAVTLLATTNSPTWLANKGRLGEAEKALCRLRGWVEPDRVQTETRALADIAAKSKSNSSKTESWRKRSRRFFQLFLQRSLYFPLGTSCLLYLLYGLSGMEATETYATVIFRELDSPIEASLATTIMGAMSIAGNLIVMLIVRRTGKRKLVFISVVVVGSCQAIVAAVGLLELRGDYLWVSPVAVIVGFLANFSGIGSVVFMVACEIFPASLRYIGTAISATIYLVLKSVVNKFFLYAVEAVTLPGVFLGFSLANLAAVIAYYYVFPETEGKSLDEIEDHFKDIVENKKEPKE